MNEKIMILSIAAASVLFTGCGGGGGGNSTSTSPSIQSISGSVVDPEIKDAIVSLECSNGNVYNATRPTNAIGQFTINNIKSNENLENCTVVSKGGKDGAENLNGKTLKAPYKLFSSKTGLLVTPLTTVVANHNEVNSDLAKAKAEIRTFFNLNEGDILKNPVEDLNIAKKTKQITKIAIKSAKGFNLIDIDDEITSNNFTDFINTEIDDSVIPNSLAFKQELEKVKNYTSFEEMRKEGITPDIYNYMIELYKITDDTNYKTNLEYLSEEILKAAKEGNIYISPTDHQIRKALYDLGLNATFKIDTNDLTDELNTKLTTDLDSFKTNNTASEMKIKGIFGITLFDSSTYKNIVGNNNDERIEYYLFSDKSHIAKAIDLISNSYDDQLLNPSYVQIATGFAKEGFTKEAFTILKENIYGSLEKIEANNSIANVLISHKNNADAKKLLDENFDLIKAYFTKKGYANLDSNDSSIVLNLFYKYFQINETQTGEKVIDYLEKTVAPVWNSPTTYGRLAVAYRNLIWDLIEDNKVNDAKYLFNKAANYVKSIPHTSNTVKSAVSNILLIAHLGPVLKENDETTELINTIKEIDTTYNTAYAALTAANYTGSIKGYATYAGEIAAITALNGDVDNVVDKLKNGGIKAKVDYGVIELERDDEETALEMGIIASLFINNKNQEAMDLLYEYRPFKSYEGDPYNLGNQIYRNYAPRDIAAYLDTPRILKAYSTEKMAEFFDALISDMENRPWTLDDKAMSKYVLNIKYGLPIIAKHYNDIENTEKRDETIQKAVTLAKAMTDEIYKLNAYHAIIDIANELKVENSATITDLVSQISTLVSNATLDNTKDEYLDKLRTAIKQAKNLHRYKSTDEAKVLITKAIDSLPIRVDGDLDNIKKRASYAIGDITFQANFKLDSDSYNKSILSALVELKEYQKAEELVDMIAKDTDTLGDSLDAYAQNVKVTRAYASINNLPKVKSTIAKIKTLKEINNAKYKAVKYLSAYDSFINSTVASVDTDGDNKADFYTKTATSEQITASGIELDDDIDGDGILDTIDELPYFNNSGK